MHEDNGQVAPCVRLWFWNPYRRGLANVQILAMMNDCRATHHLTRGLMSLLEWEGKKKFRFTFLRTLQVVATLTKSNLFPRPQYCFRCSCWALLGQLVYAKTSSACLFTEDIECRLSNRYFSADTFVKLPICQLAPASWWMIWKEQKEQKMKNLKNLKWTEKKKKRTKISADIVSEA